MTVPPYMRFFNDFSYIIHRLFQVPNLNTVMGYDNNAYVGSRRIDPNITAIFGIFKILTEFLRVLFFENFQIRSKCGGYSKLGRPTLLLFNLFLLSLKRGIA